MEIHQGKHHQACVFRDPGVARALLGGAVAAPATAPGTVPLLLPHEHVIKGVEGAQAKMLSRVRLFVFAICLHNLPERRGPRQPSRVPPQGPRAFAAGGLIVGFVLMMLLDTALG